MTDAGAAPKVKTSKVGVSAGDLGDKKRFEVKKVSGSASGRYSQPLRSDISNSGTLLPCGRGISW